MGFKPLGKFHLHGIVSANRSTSPVLDNRSNFSFHPLGIEGFVSMFGMVVDNNGFFDANAISNFHKSKFVFSR